MRSRTLAFVLVLLFAPAVLHAQELKAPEPAAQQKTETLRDRLMPAAPAAALTAPVVAEQNAAAHESLQPAMATRGAGVAYMLAGAALFVAGLIVEGDAGTVLVVAGAGIGAYGIYLHFR